MICYQIFAWCQVWPPAAVTAQQFPSHRHSEKNPGILATRTFTVRRAGSRVMGRADVNLYWFRWCSNGHSVPSPHHHHHHHHLPPAGRSHNTHQHSRFIIVCINISDTGGGGGGGSLAYDLIININTLSDFAPVRITIRQLGWYLDFPATKHRVPPCPTPESGGAAGSPWTTMTGRWGPCSTGTPC